MKKLPVDLGELQLALEDYDGGLGLHTYWFDRQTGEVIFVTEDLEEQDELREQIEENTDDRFVQIEPIDSHDGFRNMQDFVETMRPSRLREKLEWSLSGPKPFRRFKDALYENKAVQEQWHKFHDEALARYAIEWLAELGIEPLSGSSARSDIDKEVDGGNQLVQEEIDKGQAAESADKSLVSVRSVTKNDRDAVLELACHLATSFVVEREAFKDSFQEVLQNPDAYLAVAEKSGKIIGYLLGTSQPTFYANGPVGWVQELFVRPEHRRTGTGKLLMTDFERWAANRGYKLICVATRRASAFYEAIGYSASASYYTKSL
jgi:GNAT superfamily N-acetyltransferase